jgi:hypothetical protein
MFVTSTIVIGVSPMEIRSRSASVGVDVFMVRLGSTQDTRGKIEYHDL